MNSARRHSARPRLWLAVSGILAASLAAPLMAQKPAGQVQLELSNTPLTAAIEMLTQRSGAKIIIADPPSLASKKVTVSLNGMSVEKALNTILTATKTPWYKGEDGIFYINSEAPVAPVVVEATAPAPARIVTTEKIQLRSASPSDIMVALYMDDSLSVRPFTSGNSLNLLPNGRTGGLNPAGAMGPGVRPVTVIGSDTSSDQANADIQELDSAGQIGFPRGGRRGGTTGFGTQPGQPGATGTTGLGQAPNTGTNANNNQNRLVPDGIDTIFPYQEDNSLLVRGEPDAIDELKNIIQLLDVPVKQVSIKAEFVTVSDNDLDAFGLNWSTSVLNSNVTTDIGGQGTQATPTITMNIAQGNINATLTALKQNNRAHTILAPLISTLNNVGATISSNESYPIWTSSISQGNVGGNIATSTLQQIPTTTGLYVLPRINRDGSVTVQLSPQVQQINGFIAGPNGQSAPIIIGQQLQTIRRVKSGESIVLGGLQTKTDSVTTRGIPFLQDLPFVGRFFQSHDKSVKNSQLLIFLTPTIVEDDSGAQNSPG
ncbi:MAG TPA: hypothetical protein VGM51_05200 [Armatimonadota bacterium]